MTAQTKMKRHPIRGGLYGLLLGLSAAYFAFFQFAMFGFDTLGSVITKFVVIILGGVVVGIVWAYVAPPKRARGPAPTAPPQAPAAAEPPAAPAAPDQPEPPPETPGDCGVLTMKSGKRYDVIPAAT